MATAEELRQLSPAELEGRAGELRRSIFDLRTKHNTGDLGSTADLGKARKDVARCLTIKRQKELEAARAAKAAGELAAKAAGEKE